MNRTGFIPELEGLRGCLALWVFIFHATRFCGIHVPFIADGGAAVDVFIILSGFVISRLIIAKPEPYIPFMIRRAARLYPAWLIALISGVAVSWIVTGVYAAIPWQQEDVSRLIERHDIEMLNLWPLLLGHLTLLHGIFPEEILKTSSLAFVGPGWSLSLEWQFYLIAPILLHLFQSRRWQVIAILTCFIIAIVTPKLLSSFTYIVPSFLPLRLSCFMLGIATALLFDHLLTLPKSVLFYGVSGIISAMLGVTISVVGMISLLPYIIWFAVLLTALNANMVGISTFRRFLNSKIIQFLGRVSYGLYIYHSSIYICVAAGIFALGVHNRFVMLAALFLVALPLALSAAWLSYKFIELPFMNLVKRKIRYQTNVDRIVNTD